MLRPPGLPGISVDSNTSAPRRFPSAAIVWSDPAGRSVFPNGRSLTPCSSSTTSGAAAVIAPGNLATPWNEYSPGTPLLVTARVADWVENLLCSIDSNCVGYDADGTRIIRTFGGFRRPALAPDTAPTGTVTSPAVMLSPNARNRVRDNDGTFVGAVDDELPPQATSSAQHARSGSTLSMR